MKIKIFITNGVFNNHRETGSVLPLVTVALAALMAMVGLTIDSGQLYINRELFQKAADSGGLAAALEVGANNPDSVVFQSINQALKDNGISDPAKMIIVVNPSTLNDTDNGPGSPVRKNTNSQGLCGDSGPTNVEVLFRAREAFITTFMKQQNTPQTCINTSYSEGSNYSYNKTLCILSLNDKNSHVLDDKGKKISMENDWGLKAEKDKTVLSTCGIAINSSKNSDKDKSALVVKDRATLTATYIKAVGGATISTGKKAALVTPAPSINSASNFVSDPFSTINELNSYGIDQQINNGCTQTNYYKKGGSTTLQPGVYCGGIWLEGGTYTMAPGTYILLGSVSGKSPYVSFYATGSGSINGSGVFMYSTCRFGKTSGGKNVAFDLTCTGNQTTNPATNTNYSTSLPPQCEKTENCNTPGTFQLVSTSMNWNVTGPSVNSSDGVENVVFFADRKVNNKDFIQGDMKAWNILGGNFLTPSNANADSIFTRQMKVCNLLGLENSMALFMVNQYMYKVS